MNNYEKAVEIYEKAGQYAIYDAVNNGSLHADAWRDCIPCEDRTPHEDGTCLVCGTSEKNFVRLRDDLAEQGYTVPASVSFSDYDSMDSPIVYLSEDDLKGAVEYDNGVDSDAHPYIVVKVKEGRVFYLIGADLDWGIK